jgi:DNA-binding CsgD family transcriptional regulator
VQLEEKDWLFINHMTYRIQEIEDFNEMRLQFLNDIRFAIPYRYASFYLVDLTRRNGLSDPVGVGFTKQQLDQYITEFESIDYLATTSRSPESYVHRETDLFSERGRENTEYYKRAYMPLGIHYSLLLGIVGKGEFLGSVVLYRLKKDTDFSNKDLYLLKLLKNHLALRVSRVMIPHDGASNETLDDAVRKKCEPKGLTAREIEIVQRLYSGDNPEKIANDLCIAMTTLKKHISNSYRKLGVRSRFQLNQLFL